MSPSLRLKYLLATCFVLLIGTTLLVRNLQTSQRLHPDEAYFLTFARNAVMGDGMMSGALDKPPLILYAQALSMIAFAVEADGQGVLHLDIYRGEWAGRIVGIYSALIAGACLIALACHYGGRRAGILTGGLVFTSPYWSAWGASAFMDMPMLAFSLASWLAMLKGRAKTSGVLWALAFASKPQAIFLLPLVITSNFYNDGLLHSRKMICQFFITASLGVAILLCWDALRPEASIFALGAVNNIAEDNVWGDARLGFAEWWGYWRYLAGTDLLSFFMLVGAIALSLKHKCYIWLIWLVAYGGVHIITRLNIYDRYLLLTLPIIILLWMNLARWRYSLPLMSIVALLMAWSAWDTYSLPIGGDKGDYAQIDTLADYLNDYPIATVIYDRWLGWQLGYYMGEWSDKRRVYYPTPDSMARGAINLKEQGRRIFVAPLSAPYHAYLASLRVVGFTINPPTMIHHFVIYEIYPP